MTNYKLQIATDTAMQTSNKQFFATRKTAFSCPIPAFPSGVSCPRMRCQLSAHAVSVVSCPRNRGFTLIELMVTLGIFLVMTGGVLSNYRGYGTNVLFANASEDVILALRQAQIFGVGVKGENSLYNLSYGVHFSTAQNQNSEIEIFSDGNNNRIYNPELGEVRIEKTTWLSNITILSLVCDGVSCGSNAYVTFKRPTSDAFIANVENPASSFGTLAVTIEDSTTGKTSTIKVTSAGQISLQ